MQNLANLNFVDLYVRLDEPAQARFRPNGKDGTSGNRPVPSSCVGEVMILTNEIKERFHDAEGAFTFGNMRFRIAISTMANNETWAVLRRISTDVPTLEKLSFAPHIIQQLRLIGRRDGLLMISGPTGAGKTTTAFGLMNEFLHRYGGTGITIEDPVEYMMEGPVGEHGYCYQLQVQRDEDWSSAIKRSLRWTPRFILVGEIRTPRAAEQVLRAATTGHLVITTVHAGSIEESLLGLMHLAEQAMGSGANQILAAGLTAAINQTLRPDGPFLRYVYTEENNPGDPIRSLVRENRVGMIASYIDKQAARYAHHANSLQKGGR